MRGRGAPADRATALWENEHVRVRSLVLLALLLVLGAAIAVSAGCIVEVGGGGPEPTSSVTPLPPASPTPPPAIGHVDVFVRNRPRGEPCAGVPVTSSLGDVTIQTQLTDSAGHASLTIFGAHSDIAALATPDDSVAVLSVHDGDTVVVPAICTTPAFPPPPTLVHLTVSGVTTRPTVMGAVFAFDEPTGLDIYTAGTAFTATEDLDVAARRTDTFTVFGRLSHPDQSFELAAQSGLTLTSTSATLAFVPTSPQPVQISLTNSPPYLGGWFEVADPLRDDQRLQLVAGATMTPGPGGSWTGTTEVLGTEIANAMVLGVATYTPGHGVVEMRALQADLSPVSFDASVLPPILNNPTAFDGTEMIWTIATPGTASVGIARESYTDASSERHFIEAIFPPDLCTAGACQLTLPPSIRIAQPSNGGVQILYYARSTMPTYPDVGELFFGPRFLPGLTLGSFSSYEEY